MQVILMEAKQAIKIQTGKVPVLAEILGINFTSNVTATVTVRVYDPDDKNVTWEVPVVCRVELTHPVAV